ncbi:MAG TPA: hypothetical protein PKD09_10530 [Aggregatilinea sp.]|uniref:hypothetical protein n=1 Tax=Aggregatilinea sp. TaxID=2806333 RepID=UPI002CC07230|nr:hypothetical protein [Aggregatilinea sp.]HML22078.1 hypothetical protein [Aggregatilinea sp.]
MQKVTAYYIDDEQDVVTAATDTAIRYAERLSRAGNFDCIPMFPPQWSALDGELLQSLPDLFLIDYDLSRVQEDGTKAAYRGSTLANEIRARYPHIPIVLITRQSVLDNLDSQTKRLLLRHMQSFDDLILKSSLNENLDSTRQILVSLVFGFKALAQISNRNWQNLLPLLDVDDDESEQLRESAPPLQNGEWTIAEIGKWVREVLLGYPGILYDSLHVATKLGISEEVFHESALQEMFRPALYTGIFSDTTNRNRWWKGRVFIIAQELMQQLDVNGPINTVFPEVVEKLIEKPVQRAICCWDGKPTADWVCSVRNEPVKFEHTLRYYPDSRPSIMDEARVSFRAIWESSNFQEQLLDSVGIEIAREIQQSEDPRKS